MDSSFAGFGVRSNMAAFEESGKGLNETRIDLGGEITALDEAKVLVKETNKAIESLGNGVNMKGFEDMDGSQIAEMMAWNNDFMLDVIGKDLEFKFGCVEEANGPKNWREMNLGRNLKPWQAKIRKATNKHGIPINGMNQGLDATQMVPSLKSLANTFTPEGVVNFTELVAKHPCQLGPSVVAEKQAVVIAYRRWRRRTVEEGEISGYKEVSKDQSNKKACAIPSIHYGLFK